jgi:hypothetical protein
MAAVAKGQSASWGRAHTDGSYLSASDGRVHFGLGRATEAELWVDWPDGSKELWPRIPADSVVTLRQGTGRPR